MSDYGNQRCGRTVGQGSTCDLTAGHGGGCTEDWGPAMTPAANAAVQARGGRGSGDPPGLQPHLRFDGPVVLGERIDRVLALHKPRNARAYANMRVCAECASYATDKWDEDDAVWPCETVCILRGDVAGSATGGAQKPQEEA